MEGRGEGRDSDFRRWLSAICRERERAAAWIFRCPLVCIPSLTHMQIWSRILAISHLSRSLRIRANLQIFQHRMSNKFLRKNNEKKKKKTSRKSFDKHTHTELSRALLKIGKGWCEKKTRKQLQLHNWAGAGRREGEQGMDE